MKKIPVHYVIKVAKSCWYRLEGALRTAQILKNSLIAFSITLEEWWYHDYAVCLNTL